MKIWNLVENTAGKSGCLYEHGLSFYIETKHHKLLMDTGAGNSFLENAKTLSIDLKQVDTVILSHGHYDHAGGIPGFAQINPGAVVFMQKLATEEYYHKSETEERYIGIDPKIKSLSQVQFIEGDTRIDDELFLFGGVSGRRLWPSGNRVLKRKQGNEFFQDEFLHEQYLVIEEGKKRVLISGCAHNGILNILDRYMEVYGAEPDIVISGFHMMKKAGYTQEDMDTVKNIALELKKMNTIFYTGHCTGEIPYKIMKECMGEQIVYVHSGDCVI